MVSMPTGTILRLPGITTCTAGQDVKVLHFCDKVSLNAFTLFNNEEGLLEMQAMRVFDLRT
jgi:hypothetical protein